MSQKKIWSLLRHRFLQNKEAVLWILDMCVFPLRIRNPARQIKILMDMGIEERNIYVEKKSGHNFERE